MMRGGRDMRRMMDKMNLNVKQVENVQEVIIKTDKNEIVITKPDVNEMEAQGSKVFTVSCDEFVERELSEKVFSADDIETVCLQADVDEDRAKEALAEADGDIAKAILRLTS